MSKEKIEKRVKQLRKETGKLFKHLLKERKGFPLVIVYGTGGGKELALNVCHADFLDEDQEAKDNIVETIRTWAIGKNPKSKLWSKEGIVNINDTKDNLARVDPLTMDYE